MDHEPLPRAIISALDACRPGKQDETLPEVADRIAHAPPAQLAAVRRSLERVDRAIMAAVQQVPVPAGLAERILQRLPDAERGSDTFAAPEAADSIPVRVPLDRAGTAHRLAPFQKQWLLWTSGALALAACLLIAVVFWPRENLHLAEMQTQVRALYEADGHRGTAAPIAAAPMGLGGVSPQWVVGQHAIELLERGGIAYELAHRRARGTLYVVPLKRWRGPTLEGLTATPTAQSTSGTTVAAWTDDTNAYFLIAKGDSRAIWAFFPRSIVS